MAAASDRRLLSPTGKRKILGAVHGSAGLEAAYRNRLDRYIAAMVAAVQQQLMQVWAANPPALAQDASTATEAMDAIQRLAREWQTKFRDLADWWGLKFAREAAAHADRAFAAQLRKAGFTVKFKLTAAAREVMHASIAENVSLIKSIPEQFFTQVRSIVTEGVQVGRDMHVIAKGLEEQLGVTQRRAATIARDQTNKASAAILRVRQQEIGITQAVWLHSSAGRKPRPAHVAMDGKVYDVARGMWDRDEKEWVWPGQLINCRCVSRAVIPGLED